MVVNFPSIIPVAAIEIAGYAAVHILAVLLIYRVDSFRSGALFIFNYIALTYRSTAKLGAKKTIRIFGSVILHDVATQRSSFDTRKAKFVHLSIFWGFAGLAVTTTLDSVVNHSGDPLPLTHPVRILGNVSGVVLMLGLTLALLRRSFSSSLRERTSNYDLVFFLLLYASAITGFATEFASEANLDIPSYIIYLSHIILVTSLLITAPFTKFVHSIKLPVLILFYRYRHALIEQGVIVQWQPIGDLNEKLL